MVLASLTMVTPVFSDHSLEMGIPVRIRDATSNANEETYSIVLRASDTTCPMPEEAKGMEYIITAKTGLLYVPIPYQAEGSFRYTLHQQAGMDPKTYYDARIYDVTVFVSQDPTGCLESVLEIKARDGSGKVEQVEFINHPGDSWLPLTGMGSNTVMMILGCCLVFSTTYLSVIRPSE